MTIAVPANATPLLLTDLASFTRHLRAENKAPLTIHTYAKAVDALAGFLHRQGMPTEGAGIRREHIEAFLVDLQETGRRPATVAQRFRSLQQFFKWLYGFLNRWNDTMATQLEETPRAVGERYLSRVGWDGGKHAGGWRTPPPGFSV